MSAPPAAGSVNPLEPEHIRQFKDFLQQYNKLSEICFKECVWDFTGRSGRKKGPRGVVAIDLGKTDEVS